LSRIIFPEMWGDCCSRHMAAAAASGRSTHGYNLLPVIIKATILHRKHLPCRCGAREYSGCFYVTLVLPVSVMV
jgi:hypothetical protein